MSSKPKASFCSSVRSYSCVCVPGGGIDSKREMMSWLRTIGTRCSKAVVCVCSYLFDDGGVLVGSIHVLNEAVRQGVVDDQGERALSFDAL